MSFPPVKRSENIDYIRIDSLPSDQQAAFKKWNRWHTCPIIGRELDAEGKLAPCAYPWDYARWMAEGKKESDDDVFES